MLKDFRDMNGYFSGFLKTKIFPKRRYIGVVKANS